MRCSQPFHSRQADVHTNVRRLPLLLADSSNTTPSKHYFGLSSPRRAVDPKAISSNGAHDLQVLGQPGEEAGAEAVDRRLERQIVRSPVGEIQTAGRGQLARRFL